MNTTHKIIKQLFDIDINECQDKQICAFCGGDASEFKNDDSRAEYFISGLCQSCQDDIFN